MIDIHMIGGGHSPHEFEKPICLISHTDAINFAAKQCTESGKRMIEEIQRTIQAVHERHEQIAKTMKSQLEFALKEQGLWPKDFNEKTDHIMINNGVIFYARHGGE
jgi:hypothetical protein